MLDNSRTARSWSSRSSLWEPCLLCVERRLQNTGFETNCSLRLMTIRPHRRSCLWLQVHCPPCPCEAHCTSSIEPRVDHPRPYLHRLHMDQRWCYKAHQSSLHTTVPERCSVFLLVCAHLTFTNFPLVLFQVFSWSKYLHKARESEPSHLFSLSLYKSSDACHRNVPCKHLPSATQSLQVCTTALEFHIPYYWNPAEHLKHMNC